MNMNVIKLNANPEKCNRIGWNGRGLLLVHVDSITSLSIKSIDKVNSMKLISFIRLFKHPRICCWWRLCNNNITHLRCSGCPCPVSRWNLSSFATWTARSDSSNETRASRKFGCLYDSPLDSWYLNGDNVKRPSLLTSLNCGSKRHLIGRMLLPLFNCC